jgi:shikimate kinase
MSATANLLTNADLNLILTGYTGPNQPAIGRALAVRLNRRLVNFDSRLESHTGMTLETIRNTYGNQRLKTLEYEIFDEVLLNRGAVIRVSGETLSHGDTLARIAETGPVICLVASLDAVLSRMHLSMGARYHDPAERDLMLGELQLAWSARGKPNVQEIDATDLNEDETIETVIQLWRALTVQRG